MNRFVAFKLKQAFANFTASKLRSFLAVLGILVGTASVVALVTCGKMATDKALSELKALGTDLLSARFFVMQRDGDAPSARKLGLSDALAIPARVPGIRDVAPFINIYGSEVLFKGKRLQGSVVGVTDKAKDLFKISMQEGGFVSFLDTYEHYCVIGADLVTQIRAFYSGPILNEQIWLGKQIYTIIGMTNKKTAHTFFPGDQNRAVFVPIQGAPLLTTKSDIDVIVFRVDPNAPVEEIKHSLQSYIDAHVKGLRVFITSPKQIIEKMENQSHIFTWLLGLIGGISLIVGGIGVMNIMLVSVTERRREIGIRKAIGARPRDIQMLFLTESVILTLFGGCIGVGLGLMISYVISYFAKWHFSIYTAPIAIGFLVSMLTGVFFGFYPAYRAAKLDPILALRAD